MLQQLIAITAVVVGALVSYIATSASERAKWRREHAIRWDERRLEVYAAYGRVVKQYARTAIRVAVARGLSYQTEPLPPEEGMPLLVEAEDQRAEHFETLLLLGNAETVAAARAWHESAWRLEWFARGKLDDSGWQQAVDDYSEARARFYESARRDLGMPGRVPRPAWPLTWDHNLDGSLLSDA